MQFKFKKTVEQEALNLEGSLNKLRDQLDEINEIIDIETGLKYQEVRY
jgi:hypothetical protein